MTDTPILSVCDLSVTISGRAGAVQAVDNVSFDIAAGRTLAIVGESGSGKTITAMSLVGLEPAGTRVLRWGKAMFGGLDLLTLSERQLRAVRGRGIAIVFQDPAASLNPLMSAGEQIAEAVRTTAAAGRADVRARIASLLDEVGLGSVPDMARRYPHELSGGQQQRVAIAMALAGNPKLLIADEPTTALDMSVQEQILSLLGNLQRTRGMAMLLITHDLGVVANFSNDVIVLRRGEIVERGPTAKLLSAPASKYTRALLACRPRVHAPLDRLPTVEQAERNAIEARPAQRRPGGASMLLSVRDLVVSYSGRGLLARPAVAVGGVSIDVLRGGTLGIVGESGSGKSTIARAIAGLVRIRSGSVHFDGKAMPDPTRMTPAQRARLQYIFQDAYGALNPRMTVEQAVGEPFAIMGRQRVDRRDLVLKLLDEVGLSSIHLDRLPRELSGGQRQRVTLARALALEPELLICDEIVSALDVSVQAQVLNLLKDLQRDRSLSLVFISHDLGVVAQVCDRVTVLRAGRAVEEGFVRNVFTSPSHEYTRSLLHAAEALESGLPPVGALEPQVMEIVVAPSVRPTVSAS